MAERDCTCACECELDDDEFDDEDEESAPDETDKALIDDERKRLMQASAVLGCLVIGLDEVEGIELDHGDPDFSLVAEAVRGLIEEAIINLDSVSRYMARQDAEKQQDDDKEGDVLPSEQAQGPPAPD